jgi:hypothetical protein
MVVRTGDRTKTTAVEPGRGAGRKTDQPPATPREDLPDLLARQRAAFLRDGPTSLSELDAAVGERPCYAWKGKPLYDEADDAKLGDTTGHKVAKAWFVVQP